MVVTTLTAEHVLRYIFATNGQEAPFGPIPTTWPLFREFLHLPSTASSDIASVQISRGQANDPHCIQLVLARQLTDEVGGYGPVTRSIELAYYWELAEPFAVDVIDLWSNEFPSLAEFCAAVEGLPQLGLLDALAVQNADILVEEKSRDEVETEDLA